VDSRRRILSALRAAAPADVPLPELPRANPRPADPARAYAEALTAVGGACVPVPAAALAEAVAALAAKVEARRIASTVPGVAGDVDLAALDDPHQLEGVDLAVLRGEFAVAENGAVWVDTRPLGVHRGLFVVTQHLALVVRAGDLVADMHEAYERLSLEGAGFRLFIAGPSKTADIEQSLVIGAHGARSCTVFLIS
jgi:L-lactate dehydrogenase complex protein LldG